MLRLLIVRAAVLTALSVVVAALGPAQFPGGGIPGGRIPGPVPNPSPSPVPDRRAPDGSPFPGGAGRRTEGAVPAPDLPDYMGPRVHYGAVDKIDEKQLIIVASDKRIITFDLFDKTEYFREGEEAKRTDVHPGDEVRVEADRSDKGYLAATRVYVDETAEAKKAKAEAEAKSAKEAEKPEGAEEKAESAEESDRPTIRTESDMSDYSRPPPRAHVPVDDDDPGPPRLRRKGAEEIAEIEQEQAAQVLEPPPPSPPPPTETFTIADEKKPDVLIEQARAKAASFTASLPNFICRQLVTRFQSNSKPADWVALDMVEAEVAFEDGQESYQAIKVNGKLLKKQEMSELEGGAWSMGEFGSVLNNLFERWTLADFKLRKSDRTTRPPSKVYYFHVEQARSNWQAQVASVSYLPEYRGTVWIAEEDARVMRIEMEALNLPISFPVDTLEMNIDYGLVRISGQEYLLPVHSESLSCMRGDLSCSWNKIDFRNYRRFSAESTLFQTESEIKFGDKEAPAEAEPEPTPGPEPETEPEKK
ncbi:MAG: DUF5666 domain-containing protein [Acidobacteria bacterium]|nr:DUF5666 domain-containing protein [Acidobacteriota bacterium]